MLDKLKKIHGNKTAAKRRGRGYGSGKGGHTTGTGMKGQKARKSNSIPRGFEGGQVPLYKRLPQLGGFKNKTTKDIAGVSLVRLMKFKSDTTITPKMLVDEKILRYLPKHGVKLLSHDGFNKKMTFKGFKFSEGAKQLIEKIGGKIE